VTDVTVNGDVVRVEVEETHSGRVRVVMNPEIPIDYRTKVWIAKDRDELEQRI